MTTIIKNPTIKGNHLKQARIVVLCEDRTNAQKIRQTFEPTGYALKLFHSNHRLLTWLSQHPADLVLIDAGDGAHTPEKIFQIRNRFPLMPILLVANGCDRRVLERSIQAGANHFVGDISEPKQVAAVIDRLLQFRLEHLRYVKVLPHMKTTLRLELPSDLELLGGTVYYLTEELFKHGLISLEQINVKIALVEALTNAMEHGNKFDPNKKVYVQADFDYEKAVFDIRDEGEGFDFEGLPDPTQKEFLYKPRGRGVYMMRQFMDEVIFHPPGNRVTLIKRRAVNEALPRPYPWERRAI